PLVPHHGAAGRARHSVARRPRGARPTARGAARARPLTTVRAAACAAALAGALAVAACAGPTIDNGIFRAPSGYRVTLPRDGWSVDRDSGADLELRHQSGSAAMLVNGVCDVPAVGRRPDVLVRQLLLGLRDRKVIESGEVLVNGRTATHTLMEGRMQK